VRLPLGVVALFVGRIPLAQQPVVAELFCLSSAKASLIRSLLKVRQIMVMAMLLVTSNKEKQLLMAHLIGPVRPAEFAAGREELAAELLGLSHGFRYLVDFTHLESMGLECMSEMGRVMELIAQAGVGMVVRVIPDPSKDIGMNILTIFHYPHGLHVATCQNMTEAASVLGL